MGTFAFKKSWAVHVVGWVLFLLLPLTIVSREPNQNVISTVLTSGYFWGFCLIYVVVFYANTLLFIPKLFLNQRYLLFTATFITGLLLMFYLQPFEKLVFEKFHRAGNQGFQDEGRMPGGPPAHSELEREPPPIRGRDTNPAVDFVSLVLFITVWVIALATKISEQWRLTEKKVILSEADKAQAELSFFKAQINPHFLFNTLNNIYALAVSQSEHTAPSIMKLSRMMRYITDEATEDFVPLEDEIICLENYIDLQRLRLNAKTKVEFNCEGEVRNITIAPLILMTFVENAFKYGVSNRFENRIEIRLNITDGRILFSCKNQIFETDLETESTGIGISNTRKRLDFLYANRYKLEITNDKKQYAVQLELRPEVI